MNKYLVESVDGIIYTFSTFKTLKTDNETIYALSDGIGFKVLKKLN